MGALGVPVIYVFGGRDENGNALDVVQKYYPPTFGTEDVYPVWDIPQYSGQIVNNQTDIWTSYFAFHDRDMCPQRGQCPNPPMVPDRPKGQRPAIPLNPLPEPLYGAQAVTVETNGNVVPPTWPQGPYNYIFILGGINADGAVVPTMRWFNTAVEPQQRQGGGQELAQGDYSPVVDMPVERAYFKAFVIPPRQSIDRKWQIVVFGGFDQSGNYVAQVDRYNFTDTNNPVMGYWETIGSVPEPAAGLGAGWEDNATRGIILHQMSGRTVEGVTGSVFDLLEDGPVSYAPVSLIPRGWIEATHVTNPGLMGPGAPDYYLISGITEQGPTTIVEHYRP
ncbi:MAG: hypothetical protein B1H03_01465 [Planctomycetales bacterium 4484_113]|nr:MAG: hypothetical protein B1H03_01465 [Planctomycetales bacterium 4484_113]